MRHTLLCVHTFLTGITCSMSNAVDTVIRYIQHLAPGTTKMFGLVADRSHTMQATAASKQEPRIAAALSYVIRTNLMIDNAVAARVGHGPRRLGRLTRADSSYVY